MPDDSLPGPVLHLLQAGARVLDKRIVHVDEGEEEQQRLGQQQELNGQLHLPESASETVIRERQ